ncbi:efflux RND transporter periplasmic adaptor subunit [Pseudomonas aeruginosa]|uniref:efflux RND transporter periplasmic adaptor subunit n=1 Tax=Pseudomonas aeruginosa TaxID=287 RepID=UPI000F5C2298|nr:efflux RND transporter periplasmic adaptor subunit [Pseudomonas aeruginosa]RQJ10730.1 efflux transporter periplasmic adaptor subunit [Pseudomonas aeruginosa]HEJ3621339.1 efflux RND transporter periplasmic adaptor subunit [Pseudomonas aeruginosa]
MMSTSSTHFLRRPTALMLLGIAATIVISGLFLRWSRASELRGRSVGQSVPAVALIAPTPVSTAVIELPARIEAWARAPIYARVSGYLSNWTVDIGGKVKSGQTLAEIETPDLDQELQQARAELTRARSEAALAETTARRWQSLLTTDSVSRQETEERLADAKARQAQVNALQANVERIQALQQFKRLAAPFDGIVTARRTDVGSLINVGMNPGNELFVVSDTHRLRVYVNVPQRQVASIREGSTAQLSVPERPGRTFAATVQSLAQAIDSGTGAMRVQLSVENPDGVLLPGGFATVRFNKTEDASARFGLPPSALIISRGGVQVASVDDEGRVQLRPVTISRDHGRIIELADSLSASDRFINNPPDGLLSGDPVRVSDAASQEAAQ